MTEKVLWDRDGFVRTISGGYIRWNKRVSQFKMEIQRVKKYGIV